jgi:hypothetical protein
VELQLRPAHQEYRVQIKDFPRYCKEMKLNHAKMEAVATGKQYEHTGWVSDANAGALYDQTRAGAPPIIADGQSATPEKQVMQLKMYQPAWEPIIYSPNK